MEKNTRQSLKRFQVKKFEAIWELEEIALSW